ncbi:MAG: hypothetical protein LBR25_06570 [Erysipelotrichaceae bacterium]|nr:hypothetical protein [Erysipelotrichaceae bacterium]
MKNFASFTKMLESSFLFAFFNLFQRVFDRGCPICAISRKQRCSFPHARPPTLA